MYNLSKSVSLPAVISLCNSGVPAQLCCRPLPYVCVLYWNVLMKVPDILLLLFPGSLCLIITLNF